jgi:hypothetical protein
VNTILKIAALAMLASVCVACSQNQNATTPVASSASASTPVPAASSREPGPASSAIPMLPPTASVAPVSAMPANGPSLGAILQRPAFAKAFETMPGASAVPAWVKTGDADAPSMRVKVDGRTMWLSHVCRTADCRGDQLFLLTDPARQAMQGLFVETSGKSGASTRKLNWLGNPDAAAKSFLEARISGS